MDLIKIGKYIAGKRKSLGMTQKQLAEKLGMSDKSVSKWERGVCLPDVSVYKKLCSIVIIVWHIGKCKKIFLLVRRRGDFICCLKSLEKYKESSYPTD